MDLQTPKLWLNLEVYCTKVCKVLIFPSGQFIDMRIKQFKQVSLAHTHFFLPVPSAKVKVICSPANMMNECSVRNCNFNCSG